jgi:hypothetical protein
MDAHLNLDHVLGGHLLALRLLLDHRKQAVRVHLCGGKKEYR